MREESSSLKTKRIEQIMSQLLVISILSGSLGLLYLFIINFPDLKSTIVGGALLVIAGLSYCTRLIIEVNIEHRA